MKIIRKGLITFLKYFATKYAINNDLIHGGDDFYCSSCKNGKLVSSVETNKISWLCQNCGKLITETQL